ncbi:hypothetical protein AVEN_260770-1, partial [Araneus ventricosus]
MESKFTVARQHSCVDNNITSCTQHDRFDNDKKVRCVNKRGYL